MPVSGVRAFALAIVAIASVGCSTIGMPDFAFRAAVASAPMSWDGDANADAIRFYERRNFRPVWTGGDEAEAAAVDLKAILLRADEHGLRPADYAVAGDPNSQDYEIALTEALLRYARDLRFGRVRPEDVYADAELPRQEADLAAALDRALRDGSVAGFLDSLAPQYPEYRGLVAALARYRMVAELGGLPRSGQIDLGRESEERSILVARLKLEDSALAAEGDPSAQQIRAAVRRFQERNRLAVDGVVGPNTLAALGGSATTRIETIEANLERWRWLPREFESRYIAVNVPDQSLSYVSDGEVLLASRVIVGRSSSTTPILKTSVVSVKANPPWNVPGDIAARDLLPYLRRNPNYLAERNMVLLDTLETDPHGREIDWDNVEPSQFYYRVRQLPGSGTALGDLMLDMPNDFDVYLHDTPQKNLFGQADRAVSNGCIRVQEIFSLASLALTGDAEAGLPEIRDAVATRETQFLELSEPLPVYLLYWTAIAEPDGSVRFAPDPYGRDPELVEALQNRPGEPRRLQRVAAR